MKKYIPDCITLMNLLCGVLACISALQGSFFHSFLFIVAAAVFDFFDGFAARMLGAYSDLGKELDSLCDNVSFGLAPSLMMYTWMDWCWGTKCFILPYIALLPALFSALRLAKFNTDTRQSVDFIGLPVPGMAMVVAPAMAFVEYSGFSNCGCNLLLNSLASSCWFLPLVSIAFCYLLICEIPMFSMKHKKLSFKSFPKGMTFFICFAAILLFYIVYGIASPMGADLFHGAFPLTISTSFVVYILINVITCKRK